MDSSESCFLRQASALPFLSSLLRWLPCFLLLIWKPRLCLFVLNIRPCSSPSPPGVPLCLFLKIGAPPPPRWRGPGKRRGGGYKNKKFMVGVGGVLISNPERIGYVPKRILSFFLLSFLSLTILLRSFPLWTQRTRGEGDQKSERSVWIYLPR